MPHRMGLRIAMKQQEWRTRTAGRAVDRRAISGQFKRLKSLEHELSYRAVSTERHRIVQLAGQITAEA